MSKTELVGTSSPFSVCVKLIKKNEKKNSLSSAASAGWTPIYGLTRVGQKDISIF